MANNLYRKTVDVYKNRGLKGLAQKTKSYTANRLNPLHRRLTTNSETLEQKNLLEEYERLSDDIFQITSTEIEASQQASSGLGPKSISTALWFVPNYDHFGFNGIQTIFRFIEKLSQEGVSNLIVIYDYPPFDVEKLKQEMHHYFPDIANYEIIVLGDDKDKGLRELPPSDIAFCTIWISAYLLLRYNKTKRKYYFIQDFEPLFYVAGSTYALAESTYRFGFSGIVNTPGLLAVIKHNYGLEGMSFTPAVNPKLYYPDPNRDNPKVRIFFYARPLNPRNSFNLGILTIKHLLNKYGSEIEVITAGANWDEDQYGLHGRITNLGLLKTLDEVAALYRTCDIGFAYMMNKHTTYQMMEYSASGMATVMNNNEDHHWLHQDGVNCLLAEPSPSAMAEKIGLLIKDPLLRKKLVANASQSLSYTWDQQTDLIWQYIVKSN